MAAESRLHRLRARLSDSHLWARRLLHELGAADTAAPSGAGGPDGGWTAWRARTAAGGDGAGGDSDSLDEVGVPPAWAWSAGGSMAGQRAADAGSRGGGGGGEVWRPAVAVEGDVPSAGRLDFGGRCGDDDRRRRGACGGRRWVGS
jgi:hypothetical protein